MGGSLGFVEWPADLWLGFGAGLKVSAAPGRTVALLKAKSRGGVRIGAAQQALEADEARVELGCRMERGLFLRVYGHP